MGKLHFSTALLPEGWRDDVTVTVQGGAITAVAVGRAADAQRFAGAAIPGLPNVHSHTFQRGMAGLTERRGPTADSFWTWRELM
jgi:formimidoylglutamate deiminase